MLIQKFCEIIFLWSLVLSSVFAQTWNTQMVNPGSIVGSSSIFYDEAGNPNIVYPSERKLLFAKWNGTSWNSKVIVDYSNYRTPNDWNCIDVDSRDGKTVVIIKYFYTLQSGGAAYIYQYRTLNDNGEVINSGNLPTFQNASIIGNNGKVYFSYYINGNVYLNTLDIESNSFGTVQLVDGSSHINSGNIDVTLDQQINLWISYYDNVGDNIKVSKSKNSNYDEWDTWFVDTTGDVGSHSQIWVDDSNVAHISYYDATNQKLKYATFNP